MSKPDQTTLNVILVAALGVTTTIVGVGVLRVVDIVEKRLEKQELRDEAMLNALHSFDKRLTAIEAKQDISE